MAVVSGQIFVGYGWKGKKKGKKVRRRTRERQMYLQKKFECGLTLKNENYLKI